MKKAVAYLYAPTFKTPTIPSEVNQRKCIGDWGIWDIVMQRVVHDRLVVPPQERTDMRSMFDFCRIKGIKDIIVSHAQVLHTTKEGVLDFLRWAETGGFDFNFHLAAFQINLTYLYRLEDKRLLGSVLDNCFSPVTEYPVATDAIKKSVFSASATPPFEGDGSKDNPIAHPQDASDSLKKTLVCPKCGGCNYRKNGKSAYGFARYACKTCGKYFQGERFRAEIKKVLTCYHCGTSGDDFYRNEGRNPKGVSRHFCKKCNKYFLGSVAKNTETLEHVGECVSSSEASQHQKTHSTKREDKRIKCAHCGCLYHKYLCVNKLGAARYRCNACKRTFQESYKKKPQKKPRHLPRVELRKKKQCPQCHTTGKDFYTLGGGRPNGIRTYKCKKCGKSFSDKYLRECTVEDTKITVEKPKGCIYCHSTNFNCPTDVTRPWYYCFNCDRTFYNKKMLV